jgi:ribosomal protein L22
VKISKQKIREILTQIRDMKDDRAFNIITSLEDKTYLKHRAIEAIQCEDYLLACKLLVILLTYEATNVQIQSSLHRVPHTPEQKQKMEKRLAKIKEQKDADRS